MVYGLRQSVTGITSLFIAESSTALLSSGKAARYVLYTTPRQSYRMRMNV
ncbi:hypothetical protein CLOSTHATH_02854 [Hungatella hathewayi DSM 13479]|uniref:Uncharacterized protein n=1 Tax=Hungatella hathewayi DSM 13479 TaxID=566550 RepID=D3AGW7_9FIRM|nr:hypothetical protein CLOSTHATH_02854 [Hungatella hathewayi DSM 13479]